jgi:hypothetical protein
MKTNFDVPRSKNAQAGKRQISNKEDHVNAMPFQANFDHAAFGTSLRNGPNFNGSFSPMIGRSVNLGQWDGAQELQSDDHPESPNFGLKSQF